MTKEEAKHLSEVLKAYSEGKEIEIYDRIDGWIPICKEPCFVGNPMVYRIKPEPKLRPYKNTEEFLQAQSEHGPYIIGNCLFIPLKIYEDAIVYYAQKDEKGFEQMFTFVDLADRFAWQDGSPCGIMEE